MLYVEDEKIYLTKGDDGVLPVNVETGDGAYEMGGSDVLTISVRELPSLDSPLLLRIQSEPGSNRIVFTSADTADMQPGRYSADIQLNDGAGRVHTIWPRLDGSAQYTVKNFKNFVLMPEVTE